MWPHLDPWLIDTSQLCRALLWLMVSSYELPHLLTCGYICTKQTSLRKSALKCQFKVFHEVSLLIILMIHSCKQSAAQKVFQWKYVMTYHM